MCWSLGLSSLTGRWRGRECITGWIYSDLALRFPSSPWPPRPIIGIDVFTLILSDYSTIDDTQETKNSTPVRRRVNYTSGTSPTYGFLQFRTMQDGFLQRYRRREYTQLLAYLKNTWFSQGHHLDRNFTISERTVMGYLEWTNVEAPTIIIFSTNILS